jgi:hypothetical protein
MGLSRTLLLADHLYVNKWADLTYLAGARVEDPGPGWDDPDQLVLDHMREILGVSLFDGCGQPDCFDCGS